MSLKVTSQLRSNKCPSVALDKTDMDIHSFKFRSEKQPAERNNNQHKELEQTSKSVEKSAK